MCKLRWVCVMYMRKQMYVEFCLKIVVENGLT
jgi:hypothetical protein